MKLSKQDPTLKRNWQQQLIKHSIKVLRECCALDRLTCAWGEEAAGGADALTQTFNIWFGIRAQRHRQEVVEVDRMSLTLGQAGQAAARRLQALLLQYLADACVHA